MLYGAYRYGPYAYRFFPRQAGRGEARLFQAYEMETARPNPTVKA